VDAAAVQHGADELIDGQRLARALEAELERLPESHRVAFELVKNEGLSIREAAEVLGATPTAVKLRAHRAYAALRAALGHTVDRT
jgi:RNA polymerase sigma-70 factor (ECF subfamily)